MGQAATAEQTLYPNPLYGTYARTPQTFVRGEGVWLFDDEGRRYLDFVAGIAVNALGHCHPHLVETMKAQAETLWHTSNLFQIDGGQKLAARLCAATFADKVFFTNSGAEALECAIKTARRYHFTEGAPERSTIITFEGAFHGRTLATIAAGGNPAYLEGFGPPAAGFENLAFGDHDALNAALARPDVAAVLIEPVQGEGGVRSVPDQCLIGLREACDRHGVLLIFDEVQTGVGRTGYLFAHQRIGVEPDIMAVAKGIGGGFPLGACLAREEVAAGMVPGTHGTTYGGNPMAMAIGNAVLDIVLDEGFLESVRERARDLTQSLSGLLDLHPELFEEIRGEGLLRGLKCKVPVKDVVTEARNQGLLLVAAGDNTVRLLPPLIVTSADIAYAMDALEATARVLDDRSAASA
ncbi:MAG: aspartate aminotransferase family protein [Devosiaceae bacterium]|nr:aspartate aminotransferase family protein [Devosiaceae bacterium MH13]